MTIKQSDWLLLDENDESDGDKLLAFDQSTSLMLNESSILPNISHLIITNSTNSMTTSSVALSSKKPTLTSLVIEKAGSNATNATLLNLKNLGKLKFISTTYSSMAASTPLSYKNLTNSTSSQLNFKTFKTTRTRLKTNKHKHIISLLTTTSLSTTSSVKILTDLISNDHLNLKAFNICNNTYMNQQGQLDDSQSISNLNSKLLNMEDSLNMWKLAFFVLAFLLCFIIILMILTFSIRVILSKIERRCGNSISSRRTSGSKFKLDKSKLLNSISNKHTSSLSLFELDQESISNFAMPTPSKNQLNLNKCTNKPMIKRDSTSSSNSTTSNASSNPNCHHLIHQNCGHLKNSKKIVQHINSINSRVTDLTTLNANASSSISSSNLENFKNEQLINVDFNFMNSVKNPINPRMCYIYGITNRAFLDDSQGFPIINNQKQIKDMPLQASKSFSSQTNIMTSSFRPLVPQVPQSIRKSSNDIPSKVDAVEKITQTDAISIPTYQQAWKICTSTTDNVYEALEINNQVMMSTNNKLHDTSTANLSQFTSYSDVFDDEDQEKSSSSQTTSHSKALKINANNNELISRSHKITQELEMKLKERRLMVDKHQLYRKEESKINCESLSSTESSLSSLDESDLTSKSNKVKNRKNEVSLIEINSREKKASCTCPCHHHCIQNLSNHKQLKHVKNHSTTHATNVCKSHVITSNSKVAKLPIDGSTTLPTKRESIRKLIENKAVSENKKREQLEIHLNTLLSSRNNTILN